jgi:hypothetical protein
MLVLQVCVRLLVEIPRWRCAAYARVDWLSAAV